MMYFILGFLGVAITFGQWIVIVGILIGILGIFVHFRLMRYFGIFFICWGLVGLTTQVYYARKPEAPKITWGVTFSELMSRQLGLEWKENYAAILYDLKPKTIRLIAYWPFLEPGKEHFDFINLDWQMDEAGRAGIPVVLTIGQKVPRWPECHYPAWFLRLESEAREKEFLRYLEAVAERYKSHPALSSWQIENEPYFYFGECPAFNEKVFEAEVALVRQIDPDHLILISDSGEFGDWYRSAMHADIVGSTLYRKAHNDKIGRFTYPIPPEFYPLKKAVVQFFTKKPEQKFVMIEVGTEPWGKKQIYETPIKDQLTAFSPADFKRTVRYARGTGFDTFYFWGVEWWYWLTTQGEPKYWNLAKDLMQPQ